MNLAKKVTVLLLIASIAGIVVSFSLLKEDVVSTAHTLTVYFPNRFGVTPASTEEGGMRLGWFVTIVQIVAAGIVFSSQYPAPSRWVSGLILLLATPFDAWTDVVFRSGYLTGDIGIATTTTIAFYTFGSEVMQSLSWVLFLSVWRQALADMMWGIAYTWSSLGTLGGEWKKFAQAAQNKALRDSSERSAARSHTVGYSAQPASRSVNTGYPVRPQASGRPTPTYTPISSYEEVGDD